jgi:SPP1 gp7 family putative phage head morphogenesis protein
MAGPVDQLLFWINSEVDKLSGAGLGQMADILSVAERELSADLAQWLSKHKGPERYTTQVHRNALAQVQSALQVISARKPLLVKLLQGQGSLAASTAVKHLIVEVEKFSALFEGTIRPIPFEAAAVIARGSTLWPRYETSAARYVGQVGDDIRRQLGIGVVRGETIDGLTTRLARLGGPKGLVALQGKLGDPGARAEYIAEGLFTRYRHWGERLARTEVVNAYNTVAMDGIRQAARDDSGYIKKWDAAIDARTCEICGILDDQIASVDGAFPGGFTQPPRHPNCRCAIVLWRENWKTPIGTPVPHEFDVQDAPARTPDFADEIARAVNRRTRPRRGSERAASALVEAAKQVADVNAAAALTAKQAAALAIQEAEQAAVRAAARAAAAKKAEKLAAKKAAQEAQKAIEKKAKEQIEHTVDIVWKHAPQNLASTNPLHIKGAEDLFAKHGISNELGWKIWKKHHAKLLKKASKPTSALKQKVQAGIQEWTEPWLDHDILHDPEWIKNVIEDVAYTTKASEAYVKKQWDKFMVQHTKMLAKKAKQAAKLEVQAQKSAARAAKLRAKAAKKAVRAAPASGRYVPTDFDDVPTGLFGRGFSSDADAIDNGSMQVRRTVDGYEVTFKSTAHHEEKLRDLAAAHGTKDPFVFYRRRLVNGLMETDATEFQTVGDGSLINLSDPSGKMYGVEVGFTGATRNYVRITVDGDSSRLHAALQDFSERTGLDVLKRPDQENVRLQAMAQLSAKFHPPRYAAEVGAKATPEKIRELFDDLAKRNPIMNEIIEDVEERELFPGHRGLYSQRLADYMSKHNHVLTHDGSPPVEIVESIITETGLLASSTRFQSGIFTTGMSTMTDFRTGGADGVFLRVRKKGDGDGYLGARFRFVVDKQELGRLDWYGFDFDNFGRAGYDSYDARWRAPDMASPDSPRDSNEVMPVKGVPQNRLLRVLCSAGDRRALLKALTEKGVTEINGVKIGDFIVESK